MTASSVTPINYRAGLYAAMVELAHRGVTVAPVRIEWDVQDSKKRMVTSPPGGWQLGVSPTDAQIEEAIKNGCNAYLYRLPPDVWVLDTDSAAATGWAAQFGPADVVTPRGEHRLYRWHEHAHIPTGGPVDITHGDRNPRQLYGPGSFYDIPGRGTVVYTGVVPDFGRLPEMPLPLRRPAALPWPAAAPTAGAPVAFPTHPGVAPVGPVAVDSAGPTDAFFRPPPITRAAALRKANEMAQAIRTGPMYGDGARDGVRDLAFFLGGLLHMGWWSADHARELLLGACAYRWGQADDDDATWLEQGLRDGQKPGKRLLGREDDPRFGPFEPAPGSGEERSTVGDRLLTLDQMDALPDPQPWLDGLIDKGSFTLIYGEGGSGKSFVALDMVLCAASGRDWHGRTLAPSRVLYVVGEGQSGIRARARAWRSAHGVPAADVHLITHPGAIDLYGELAPGQVSELIDACRAQQVDVVVFDTWNQCTPGLEENSAKDAQLAILNIKRIQESGITVIVIHHTSRDGNKPRGSTALEFATDHALYVTKSGLVITVESARQKDREKGEKFAFILTAEVLGPSAYLVPSLAPVRSDPTNGAARLPEHAVYDVDRPATTGVEEYEGAGAAMIGHLAQMLAQRPTESFSYAQAVRALTGRSAHGTVRRAWAALGELGALTSASGRYRQSRTTAGVDYFTGSWQWVPAGEQRGQELTNRIL